MKVFLLILTAFIMYPVLSNGQQTGTIHVNVDEIKNENGTLRIELYSDKDKFLVESFSYIDVVIDNQSQIQISFDEIPFGVYAVSIYHDLNDNNVLESNFVRMPQEPVGFSNDHQPKLGPPRFNKAKFILDQEAITIKISMYSY